MAMSLLTSSALADPPDADNYEAQLVRAVAAKERALDADDAAHWQEALKLFQAADAVRATPEGKYEIGFAAQRLGQSDLAIEAYEAALELGLKGPAREKAAAFLADNGPKTARVQVTGPAGAEISVNGVRRGTLPFARPLVVTAGVALVEMSSGGGRAKREIRVAAGEQASVDMMREAPPMPAEPVGSPQTQVATPASTASAVAGPGEAAMQGAARETSHGTAWVLIGTGIALTALSAITIPVSNGSIDNARHELAQSCPERDGLDACLHPYPGSEQQAQNQVDTIATWKAVRTGAWIGLGAGGVALVTGIALRARQSRTPEIRPRGGSSPAARASKPADLAWHLDVRPTEVGASVMVGRAF